MYEKDGILYAETPEKIITVEQVKPLDGYRLELIFSTGEKGIYDVSSLLEFPVFRPLKDITLFNSVKIDFGTVSWLDGEVDIAPEALYYECEKVNFEVV